MGQAFASIEAAHREFIARQRIFFTASAAAGGRVNVSPKDTASLRILGPRQVVWMDLTGSGNETAAHLRAHGQLTVMFCGFEEPPMILRFYGRGRVLARGTAEYRDLLAAEFGSQERPGARQMILLDVDRVQSSCGYGVPRFDYVGERPTLTRWAQAKGEDGLEKYWRLKNSESIDGLPTGIGETAGWAGE